MSDLEYFHEPVLLEESVGALITDPDGVYIDATYGGGGHSKLILKKLGKKGRLFAFDQDEAVAAQLIQDPKFEWVNSNFRYLKKYMDYYKIKEIHGVLADLGLSSYHIDENKRGFSFNSDFPLDMRMNVKQELTAEDIIMKYSESDLKRVFKEYGEITNAEILVQSLQRDRRNRRFDSCKSFAQWAEKFVYGKRNKYLAQIFQALRIEVNQEIDSLKNLLEQATELLVPDGRLVCISYHSLEDRLVKQCIKNEWQTSVEDEFFGRRKINYKAVNKHVVMSGSNELEINSRSRSAKLRIGIKVK
ncbi:MAG: 16S rRNA (cytosine(1402)-N(4))-methyltransferase RsmH [Bacteroidota bacterium]|nr:16S rRNA (cytosine(1402)-N(4))-methyltransferase RsmH [Bacteroidota bacterium]